MASLRKLKKAVNTMVYDVVGECFDLQKLDGKKKDATDKIMDEAESFQKMIMTEINKAKVKADYNSIIEKVQKQSDEWVKALEKIA